MKKRLTVADLQFGMYIAELDRPWTETPFMYQGFLLSTAQQLEALKKHCAAVYIDTERGAEPQGPQPKRVAVYAEKASVEQELAPARGAHNVGEEMIRDALAKVRIGQTLQPERVREAVTLMTDSVLRNPDALLLYTQLQERGEYDIAHAIDSSVYMITFGRFLQLERAQIELLGYLGLLQDIGKVRLPKQLMYKRARLSVEEFERAKLHINYTVEILRGTPGLPPDLARLAGLHHERHDGSGYPNHLPGSEIGMLGSIAAIVDSYDAMTVPRPYADPLSPSAAISQLYKGRGTKYDAELVEQFIRCIGIFPVGSLVRLNTGEVGVIIAQNVARRLQPRVMVIRDAQGNPLNPQKLLDLSRSPKAAKGEPYRILETLEHGLVPFNADELLMK
jgi:HD-GYP domain-containing protein (c-di-GMP phosphodiesterase class II)